MLKQTQNNITLKDTAIGQYLKQNWFSMNTFPTSKSNKCGISQTFQSEEDVQTEKVKVQ